MQSVTQEMKTDLKQAISEVEIEQKQLTVSSCL